MDCCASKFVCRCQRVALVPEQGRRGRSTRRAAVGLLPRARHRFKNRCYPRVAALFLILVVCVGGCAKNSEPRTRVDFWAIGSEVEKIGELFDEFRREN